MRIFLSILGWFFGIMFLIGSIPYFWCGEYILGLWSFVVTAFLIPPLYKFVSGRLNFRFKKPQALAVSLIIFVLLFANFVRPYFYPTKSDKFFFKSFLERQDKINNYCDNAIKKYKIKKEDSQKIKCHKSMQTYKACLLTFDETTKHMLESEKNKEISNIGKLTFLITNRTFYPLAKKMKDKEEDKFKKTMKTKWKCEDF